MKRVAFLPSQQEYFANERTWRLSVICSRRASQSSLVVPSPHTRDIPPLTASFWPRTCTASRPRPCSRVVGPTVLGARFAVPLAWHTDRRSSQDDNEENHWRRHLFWGGGGNSAPRYDAWHCEADHMCALGRLLPVVGRRVVRTGLLYRADKMNGGDVALIGVGTTTAKVVLVTRIFSPRHSSLGCRASVRTTKHKALRMSQTKTRVRPCNI